MFFYWSPFDLVVSPSGRQSIQPRLFPTGATAKDFRNRGLAETSTAGRCLVGTRTQIAVVPPGVTFMMNTATDMNVVVPANIVTMLQADLNVVIPAGLLWRELLRRLCRQLGAGRWGQHDGDFGAAGSISV